MKEAELLIKQRAREKDQELVYEIEHLDLDAKNFWFHEHCRKNFTRRGHPFSTYEKFSEKLTFAYQGVRNISFSGNFAYVLNG